MNFRQIESKILARREFLSKSSISFEFTDFGAGARDENRSLEEMSNGVVCEKKLSEFAFIGIKGADAKFLFDILRKYEVEHGIKTILELGTCLGFSSILFSFACVNSHIFTLEGDKHLAEFARENFEYFGIKNIKIIRAKFSDTLAKILNEIGKIDFAFIDGHHDKDATLKYYTQIAPFMSNSAIMAFDDINYNSKMNEAWKEISKGRCAQDNGKIGVLYLQGDK